ncbi:MAG TPA: hypothetical protein VG941_02335 [Candidatus Paceibacterota bacterium]|nr:hypothetical protein [Candidatus Paceibacterota bacterium]
MPNKEAPREALQEQLQEQLDDLIRRASPGGILLFRPIAYYQKTLDCLYVICKDRSVTDRPVNEVLTLFEDNHSPKEYAGFKVEPAASFCRLYGINPGFDGKVDIHRILDFIALKYAKDQDEAGETVFIARELLRMLDSPLVRMP